MVKESVRKCSQCGHNGHNSGTCNGIQGCLKLFGVTINVAEKEDIDDESIRKSKSMGDLIACNGEHTRVDAGYLSDGLIQSKEARERKKGVPWSEDEHRSFLAGLEKHGKGDWRGISKNYVPSRTPTQVASHAQKYFIRLAATDKKRRRASLFDMSFNEPGNHHSPPHEPPDQTAEISQKADNLPSVNLNNIGDTQGQESTSSQVTRPVEAALQVLPPAATRGVPDFHQIPCMPASTSTQVARPVEAAPQVLPPAATYGVPDFHQMPYMPVGMPSNGQNFPGAEVLPTFSLVPVMNFPNHGYFYLSKSYGNFATCAPYMSQPTSGLLPHSLPLPLPHGSSQAGPGTSIIKKDDLELRIGVN